MAVISAFLGCFCPRKARMRTRNKRKPVHSMSAFVNFDQNYRPIGSTIADIYHSGLFAFGVSVLKPEAKSPISDSFRRKAILPDDWLYCRRKQYVPDGGRKLITWTVTSGKQFWIEKFRMQKLEPIRRSARVCARDWSSQSRDVCMLGIFRVTVVLLCVLRRTDSHCRTLLKHI